MNEVSRRSLVPLVILLCSISAAMAETSWPRWRGPLGTGHAAATTLPVKWDQDDVAWSTPLPGRGQSSPIVWKGNIFLTAAENEGRERVVICLDGATGKVRWKKPAWSGEPEPIHKMNSHASATCVTDGEHVYAFFGKGGLHCFTLTGDKVWSRNLGDFAGPWGTAASPILVDDLLIQNCDADDAAFLLAVDKHTGKDKWRTSRFKARGWSTPILVEAEGRKEIVVNGEPGVHAYAVANGEELWFCKGDRGRGTPTVTPYKDILIAVSGRPGDMFAFRGGGSGQVNATHEVWRTARRSGRDLPSPIVVGDHLFVMNMKGVGTCYDAGQGTALDVARIGGNFTASPIAANGLVYIPSESGETVVLRLGNKVEVVARNRVNSNDDEIFRASVTPLGSQLLIRSDRTLYCVGSPQ